VVVVVDVASVEVGGGRDGRRGPRQRLGNGRGERARRERSGEAGRGRLLTAGRREGQRVDHDDALHVVDPVEVVEDLEVAAVDGDREDDLGRQQRVEAGGGGRGRDGQEVDAGGCGCVVGVQDELGQLGAVGHGDPERLDLGLERRGVGLRSHQAVPPELELGVGGHRDLLPVLGVRQLAALGAPEQDEPGDEQGE
jgi:hypothetical protein